MGRRNAAAFSPPLSSWLHLCFPRGVGGGGSAATCVGEAREKFPLSSVIPMQLSFKIN